MNKNIIVAVIALLAIGGGAYFVAGMPKDTDITVPPPAAGTGQTDTPIAQTPVDKTKTIIGTSVEGRDIVAYHFGGGAKELVFIGGIHGGYEWNTTLVAYELMDYLKANPSAIPSTLSVTVIPVLNPDGLTKVVGTTSPFSASAVSKSEATVVAGRFNARTVDLNRNFDCDWKASGTWQNKTVSGGASPFSEPESKAIQSYVEARTPAAIVTWYSAAGGVYASSCGEGILPATRTVLNTFSKASGYRAHDEFDSYELTGDMVNWFAKRGIPAISVLLTNHTDTEWAKNKAGIDALLSSFGN